VTETQNVEFRTEFFNAFNHPNFAQPDNFIDDGPGSAGVSLLWQSHSGRFSLD